MSAIRTILLAEDSLADAEMAIDALREANLANPIVHVQDGVEALDYLFSRGKFNKFGVQCFCAHVYASIPTVEYKRVLTDLGAADGSS